MRRLLDRFGGVIALVASRGFFRSVEIEGFDRRAVRGRPVLIVANHFNGFVDPVLVVAALGRLPRFLAKAALWRVWPARPFLFIAGLIPVARPEDGAGTGINASSFAAAVKTLGRKHVVAIFPEGTTHDAPQLAPVRTGAARIALDAHAAGVRGLLIVPVGLTFDDKVALRSRVLIRGGAPIDLDASVGSAGAGDPELGAGDHDAVHALTAEIERSLREVAPDWDNFREQGALHRAAETALRSTSGSNRRPVPLATRVRLARRLRAAPVAERDRISDEVARFELSLSLLHVTDDQLEPPAQLRQIVGRLVRLAIVFLLLSPFAVFGLAANAFPALVVWAAGTAVAEPVTKGTVRFLIAVLLFPLTWIAIAVLDLGGRTVDGVLEGLLVFIAAPLCGLALIYLLEQWTALVRVARAWDVTVNRRAQLVSLRADRRVLVDDVLRVADVR